MRPHRFSLRTSFLCISISSALLAPSLMLTAQTLKSIPAATSSRAILWTKQQGAPPAGNLPDLDAARQMQAVAPQAPPPIPSTLCAPTNSGCTGGAASNRLPSPAVETPYSQLRERLLNQLAWNATAPTAGLLPGTDRAALSDSPPSLLGPNRVAAQPVGPLFVAQANANAAVFVAQSVPASMVAGQSYNVSVTMRNTGTSTWSSAANYMLGTQNAQDNTTWGDTPIGWGRVGVPSTVAPGADVTFNFSVNAPSTPGTYNFQRRVLQHGVQWFGDSTPNVAVNVTEPRINVALAANGATASASSFYNASHSPAYTIDGSYGWYWNDATGSTFPDWLQVDFNGAKTINEIDVFSVPDNLNWGTPTETGVFTQYGLTDFEVQYWNGSGWLAVPGGVVVNNNKLWRKLQFAAITTGKIRVVINNALQSWSRLVEIEAYAGAAPPPNRPPTVSLTSPSNNSNFGGGSNVVVNANAADVDGSVAKVEFFAVETKIGEDTSAPYSIIWSNVPAGDYTLIARATDDRGAVATSNTVSTSIVDFTAARLDAANRTGSTDLFSRNFSWSAPLVQLRGRAGLDLNLSMSYNSLSWVRSGSSMLFDPDRGFPTPGFRFGFPVIQGPYRNTAIGANGTNVYILISPSGGRTELRQSGDSNVYEAADSSYLRLEYAGEGVMSLRPADGSRLSYAFINGQYECTQIKDRNGNFISVGYNSAGLLSTITDTLGRVVNVNYDGYLNPISITQVWTVNGQPQTHTWATFGYQTRTVDTVFHNANAQPMPVFGAVAGRQIPVLSQVGLEDGTRYNFTYGQRGQVEKIARSARDANGQWVELSYMQYTLPANDSDCPRFTASAVWAKDWNDDVAVNTSYSVEGEMQVATLPDGTKQKTQFETTGWRRGLPARTETWGTGPDNSFALRRWTTTDWAQDDQTLGYQLNPRVVKTRVGDPEQNEKRTEIEYLTAQESPFRLPKKVSEFNGNETTPLRYTETIYKPDSIAANSAYTNLRLIGLVSEQRLRDGQGALQSKIEYEYDLGGSYLTDPTSFVWTYDYGGIVQTNQPSPQQQQTVPQHDPSYGLNYQSRGLLCVTRRHNTGAVDANNPSFVEHKTVSNIFGAVAETIDPLNHKTTVGYADIFSNMASRNTFAYPTVVIDPDQNALPESQRKGSTVAYNFDTGAVVRTKDVKGAEQVIDYDDAGRMARTTRRDTDANADKGYTRWVYSPAQDFVESFTQIETGVESYAVQVLDGAGQVRASANLLPGSAGGYSGQHFVYDKMQRRVRQSNQIEMTGAWMAAGDDAPPTGTGWVYSLQAYDWKNRPTLTTNVGGTTREIRYGGCGCAGGGVVTTRDEVGRRQKTTFDVLGRQRKIETLYEQPKTEALNGDGPVYATTVNTYNARDQLTGVMQYQGAAASDNSCPTPACQQTSLTFDGFGRLSTRKTPEQLNPTSYSYYADDAVQSVTDARGAVATYSYNRRRLVSGINYNAPSGISTPSPITYDYDAVGNRISMADASGTIAYQYNALSQLTSETRQFNGLSASFTITYGYNRAGELKSITDPFNSSINYQHDQAGRLRDVTGSGFSDVSQYAAGIKYRAWGGLKGLSYGASSQHSIALSYTPRLQVSSYKITFVIANSNVQGAEFAYSDDGRLKYTRELNSNAQDRAYTFDHTGRLTQTLSGAEARGEVGVAPDFIPFNQAYQYDAFDHMTRDAGRHWSQNVPTFSATYVNNRNQSFSYDAEGKVTQENRRSYTYNAAGDMVGMTEPPRSSRRPGLNLTELYDGDGFRAKHTENSTTTYELRSSLLRGRLLTEIDAQGQKKTGYVYADGELLAKQNQATGTVTWVERSPDGSGEWQTTRLPTNDTFERALELDPMGRDVGIDNPYGGGGDGVGSYPTYGDPTDLTSGCAVDGNVTPCEIIGKVISRNYTQFLSQVINKRIGTRVGQTGYVENYGGQGVKLGESDNATGVGYSMTIAAPPPTLEMSTIGYNMAWLTLAPVQKVTPVTHKVSLRFGNIPFTDEQMKMIAASLDVMSQEDCQNFINATLARNKVGKDFDSLDKLLSRARFSYYNTSTFLGGPDYSPSQLGLDAHDTLQVRGAFDKGATAVTASDRVHVFLSGKVFDQPMMGYIGRRADTPGYIVHELFHVAGIDKSLVDSQEMQDAIWDNCHLVGSDRIVIQH